MKDVRYPIGKIEFKTELTPGDRRALIDQIANVPPDLRAAVRGLGDPQLDVPYREGGWTIRQLVHHLPDSHMNGYVRFKLAMTEEQPAIKTYREDLWAGLADAKTAPIELSLALLESIHGRWVIFLRGLDPESFAKTINHPENGIMTLDRLLQIYAWHGRHHVAHIVSTRERMGWK
jgi:hypothetical protein